jgi:hypothetical protein
MSKMLIMLTGEIGSGKSTAAHILERYGFEEDYFSRPLKDFALSIGFEHEEIYGTQEQKLRINKFWGISGREFLQRFGSEVCRNFLPKAIPNMNLNDRTLWARTMERNIQNYDYLVISDGRFEDEAKLVNDHNGIIIRLERKYDAGSSTVSGHQSETEMKKIKPNVVIDNNGTVDDLENELLAVLKSYGWTYEKPRYNLHNTQVTMNLTKSENFLLYGNITPSKLDQYIHLGMAFAFACFVFIIAKCLKNM